MYKIVTSLRVFAVFTVLLGILYPLAITGLGQFFMPEKAHGSLIIKNNRIVGSTLIGQNFTAPQYFHGRFSEVRYNAASSGGSNFSPSDDKLLKSVADRLQQVRIINNLTPNSPIPADMVLASGSGLDPHISLSNATLQLPRVAKERQLQPNKIKKLINQSIDPDFIGIWGHAGVNVLQLNLALDAMPGSTK